MAGYLYGSERARDEARQRFANAQEPVRQATELMSGAIAGAPIDSMKQTASWATAAVQTAAERVAHASAPTPQVAQPNPAEIVGRPEEPLPRYEPDVPSA
jgi:hypothetical protein